MKKISILFLLAAALGACCAQKTKTAEPTASDDLFAKGELMADNPNFTGDAWLDRLVTVADSMDCTVANVTFAPGVHNHWHSHPGGQILLCTSGKGYYHEKGKSLRLLLPGDIVKIAPNVIHRHGARPNSEFTHIAINTQVSKGSAEWLGPATDKEYDHDKE